MADSPAKRSDRVFSYTVYSEGNAVGEKYRLEEAWVRTEVNRVGKATLCFNAGDMPTGTFPESDADVFKPGATIRLDLGDPEKEKTVFVGKVVMLNLEIQEGHRSRMVVECRDALFYAGLERKNKLFEKQKDSEVIQTVLSDYGGVDVGTTSYKHASLVQYYCTDLAFALSRAAANGLLITCVNGSIRVKKPDVSAAPVLTVTYGADLIDFKGGLSAADQYGQVEAVGWDIANQTVVSAQASAPALNQQGSTAKADWESGEKYLLQADVPAEEGLLKAWADGVALRTGLARYQGSFSFYGNAAAVPGCIIELKGLGARYNGKAFIGAVEHRVHNQVWTTRAEMGVPPGNVTDEPDTVAPPASGYLPGIEGLHIGKVKQLEQDPAKEFRILVEIPLWKDTKGLWARMAGFYAGKQRGAFFVPEKGDEVVVGFFNHDPRYPVVLGSLYSSQAPASYELKADNDKKAFLSREKLKIEFDEKKKIITLETPGNNKIEMNDDSKAIRITDGNKNEIILDNKGITLNSGGKIILKAKTDIQLDATSGISMSAKKDIALDALNVKATAKMGFTAKGNATAELSASGQTTVKGGMVMIN